ncbi:hypothetical protein D3C80_1582540 [compost metagenome]
MTDRGADRRQLPGQFLEAVRLRLDQRDAEALQLCLHRRADAVRPEQDQVRLQAEQGFHAELAVPAKGGQMGQRRQARAAVEHADHPLGGAQLDHDLAERRRQRHHPPGAILPGLHQRAGEQQDSEQQAGHQRSWRGSR